MKNKIIIWAILFSIIFSFAVPAFAQTTNCSDPTTIKEKIKCSITGMKLPLGSGEEAETYLGLVLKGLFGFLAVLFFILIIYGGITWMTSQGNEHKTEQAKKIIVAATIGIAVILTSYLITLLIITLVRPST